MKPKRLIKYLREQERRCYIPRTLDEIPGNYRGYFYDPNYVAPPFDLDAQSGEFDFEAMRIARENLVMEMNLAFFVNNGKDMRTDFEKLCSRLKLAMIKEVEKKHITMVDNKTMKAYRMMNNSYYDGLLFPLVEIPKFTFDHFCSGMEV